MTAGLRVMLCGIGQNSTLRFIVHFLYYTITQYTPGQEQS